MLEELKERLVRQAPLVSLFAFTGFLSGFFFSVEANDLRWLLVPIPFAILCTAIRFRLQKLLLIPAITAVWLPLYPLAFLLSARGGVAFGFAGALLGLCSVGVLGGLGVSAAIDAIVIGSLSFKRVSLGAIYGGALTLPFGIWLHLFLESQQPSFDQRGALNLGFAIWQTGMGAVFLNRTLRATQSASPF